MALASFSLSKPQLTVVLIFFVGWGIASLTALGTLRSVSFSSALGPGAIDMVLTGRYGVW